MNFYPTLNSGFVINALWYHNRKLKESRRKKRITIRRAERWSPWNDECISDAKFIEIFRLCREDYKWLVDELKPHLQLDNFGRGNPLSVEHQVGVGLYRLGHGCSYTVIEHLFKIGKGTAIIATNKFANAVCKNFGQRSISYPKLDNVESWKLIEQSFFIKRGIPGIVGAIDGTHIPIKKPSHDRWNAFINRKGWSSITFQAVVDGEGNFRNVYGGLPGSVHDNRLFRLSKLGRGLSKGLPIIPPDTYLIGDSGYPVSKWFLTPYSNATTTVKAQFNFHHSSTRMIVEQSFGRLKNRFRLLLSPQAASPTNARQLTFCCMILHNMLNERNLSLYLQSWDERSEEEQEYGEIPMENNTPSPDEFLNNMRAGQDEMDRIREDIAASLCNESGSRML